MADLVIDASVSASWCFADEITDYTEGILTVVSGTGNAIVPRLWAYELRNSVLMGLRRSRISKSAAQAFLKSLSVLRITLTDPASYDDVFALSERYDLTVYDAAYLDLALREAVPLASLDRKQVAAAAQCGVAIFRP